MIRTQPNNLGLFPKQNDHRGERQHEQQTQERLLVHTNNSNHQLRRLTKNGEHTCT